MVRSRASKKPSDSKRTPTCPSPYVARRPFRPFRTFLFFFFISHPPRKWPFICTTTTKLVRLCSIKKHRHVSFRFTVDFVGRHRFLLKGHVQRAATATSGYPAASSVAGIERHAQQQQKTPRQSEESSLPVEASVWNEPGTTWLRRWRWRE